MDKYELYAEVIGYLKYLLRDGNEDVPMSRWFDTSRLSEHHGEIIELTCQKLAHHIKAETE